MSGIPGPASRYRLLGMCVIVLAVLGLPASAVRAQTGTYEITFQSLGYDDTMLRGPQSTTRYYFGLPSTWIPQQGGYVALHLSYSATAQISDAAALIHVWLNDELLQTKSWAGSRDLRLLVYLPSEYLVTAAAGTANTLRLEFEVQEECERALRASLTVKDSSFFHFVYQQQPIVPDLSLYPAPIYEREAFEPAGVEFLLPVQPTRAELEAATSIAARLGALTADRLPISATLSTDVAALDSANHLIVIGHPDDQPLIKELTLPVPVVDRSLALSTDAPVDVRPGEPFTYTLWVTNTSSVTQPLSLQNQMPAGSTLAACSPACTEAAPGRALFDLGSVAPGQQVSATLVVEFDPSADPVESDEPASSMAIENTATLLDDQGQVLNVSTTVTGTGTRAEGQAATSLAAHLFALGGQAVPETDGLVQEIVSPYRSDRAVLVVTGLDDAALTKAARALSSDNYIPSMWSTHALVRATAPISPSVEMPFETTTFDSLGYTDDTIASIQDDRLDYRFEMPAGWQLSNDAYLALHIAHGTALNDLNASGEVQLNNVAVGSFPLDETNSSSTWLAVPLVSTVTRAGTNYVRIQVSADPDLVCRYIGTNRYWLTVFADSFLHMPRRPAGERLSLDMLPYPFAGTRGLQDLAFLLPGDPAQAHIEGLLRFASRSGMAAGGSDFYPRIVLGGSPEEEPLPGYHLVAIGLPSDNAYLAAANVELPQRFQAGTNDVEQTINRVVYRLAPGESLGYLQELDSPWDRTRAMLAVTGTTGEGLGWALAALTSDELAGDLSGNLASVRADRVWSVDTRTAAAAEMAELMAELGFAPGDTDEASEPDQGAAPPDGTETPAATPTPAITPSATPAPTEPAPASPTDSPTVDVLGLPEPVSPVTTTDQPIWLIPLLGLSGVTLLAAVVFAIRQARR